MKADPSRIFALRTAAQYRWDQKLARAAVSEDAERVEFPGRFCPVCLCRLGHPWSHSPGCTRPNLVAGDF